MNTFPDGYQILPFKLDPHLKNWVDDKDWVKIDAYFKNQTSPTGDLFQRLLSFRDFEKIEFIISLRESNDEWQEDGIWHDDGSRVLAFSLSLTTSPIGGGVLGIRKKGEATYTQISTPQYGDMIIFETGINGFEHKIHRVISGSRLIIAGWCS